MRPNRSNVELMRKLYLEDSWSSTKIAKFLGGSPSVVCYHLEKLGVLRKNGEKPHNYKHVDEELLRELYVNQGKSSREVASILGLSQRTTLDKLQELGISRPPRVRYNGQRIKTTDGYYALFMPDHPNANRCGYVLEHRYIMSEHIGRPLKPEEVVHHRNENRMDNNLDNLELIGSHGLHTALHHTATNDEVLQQIRDFYATHNRKPKVTEMKPANGLASYKTYQARFGNCKRAIDIALEGANEQEKSNSA